MDNRAMFAPLAPEEAAEAEAPPRARPILPVPEDAPPCNLRHPEHGEPSTRYAYRDVEDRLLGYVLRWDFTRPDGTRGKEVLPATFCEGPEGARAWRLQGFEEPRPLFGLDRLAARPEALVILAEGEKAALGAEAGFPDCVGVTTPHGAGSAHKADFGPLAGRRVAVWPDHDEAGGRYAAKAAQLAAEAGAEVRIVRVPEDFPEGWDLADPPPEGWDAARLRGLLEAAEPYASLHSVAAEMTPGFRLTRAGVAKRVSKDDEAATWVRICSPLEVLAVTRNADGRDWGRLLVVTDRDGTRHEWAMPMSMLAGDARELRAELLSLGLELEHGSFARAALHEYIVRATPKVRARCVSRIGWHGGAYILPDAAFGDAEGERIVYQHTGGAANPFRTSGALEEWQAEVAKPCIGNSRLLFALSAAFAPPLLELAGAESGGVHFVGRSSIGKTTALRVAGSAWGGGGLTGFLRQWRATENGLEGVAAAHCDALLCLDELAQADAKAAGAAAYMLANGMGKSRAARDGAARPAAQWRVFFLSTGEMTLADKAAEDGRRAAAGQAVRILDLPSDAGAGLGLFETLHGSASGQDFAVRLGDATSRLYGTAARAFLERLAGDREAAAKEVRGFVRDFAAAHGPSGADGQVSRAVERFALVAAAGELATAMGVLPWTEGDASRAAAACLDAWIAARGGTGPAELREGVARVREFVQRHGGARFAPWDDPDRVTVNRAGYRRDSEDGSEFFVFPEVWRREVCAGLDGRAVARELIRLGLLLPGGDGKAPSAHRPPGGGKAVRFYRLGAGILGAGGESGDADA